MTAREVIKRLKAEGWIELKGGKSEHRQFKHEARPGKVTVPCHPGDITSSTLKSIEKQSGVKM